jgi:hypothetical protein
MSNHAQNSVSAGGAEFRELLGVATPGRHRLLTNVVAPRRVQSAQPLTNDVTGVLAGA